MVDMMCREVTRTLDGCRLEGQERSYEIKKTLYSRRDTGTNLLLAIQYPEDVVVAIKELPLVRKHCNKTNHWEEAVALQRASNVEGVIPLLDCMQDRDHLYLVMPYRRHGDLFSLVQKSPLPEPMARHYLYQMVEILLRLKQRYQMAHHDVSLENFMLMGDSLQLIDFGICVWEGRAQPSLYCGKPCYVAPELVHHREYVDIYAADIWSLGVCFYSMLTAMPLYENPMDSVYPLLEDGRTKALLHRNRWISREAKWLLYRMLHPDPACRPTLEEMLVLAIETPEPSSWWSQCSEWFWALFC